jgi:DNA-binding CsgD family transcriptional regulator
MLSGRLRPRERDVLRLAALGLDDETIAARLEISPKTVAGYWVTIYHMLGLVGQKNRKKQAIEHWQTHVGMENRESA